MKIFVIFSSALLLLAIAMADGEPSLLEGFFDLLSSPPIEAQEQVHDTQLEEILAAFEPVVARAARSTVRVKAEGQTLAFGTIVESDGGILTKASELGEGAVQCELPDGTIFPAKRERTFPKFDMVLLRIDRRGLPVAPFLADPVITGSLIATPLPGGAVSGVGIVSVGVRDLSQKGKGFLGVSLAQRGERAVIRSVNEAGAAASAGLQPGDVLLSVDGRPCHSVPALVEEIAGLKPGQEVDLRYQRNGLTHSVDVVLGDREEASELFNPLHPMDHMGGRTSTHRTGYPQAWQHDIGLSPQQMGGPAVDLDGRVRGVNIARAGRVKTYAVPAAVILDWLGQEGEVAGSTEASRTLRIPREPSVPSGFTTH